MTLTSMMSKSSNSPRCAPFQRACSIQDTAPRLAQPNSVRSKCVLLYSCRQHVQQQLIAVNRSAPVCFTTQAHHLNSIVVCSQNMVIVGAFITWLSLQGRRR